MKAVLMSVHHRHILNMHSGAKTNELRTRPPKIECPFKVYNLDTVSSGGCGKVVSEWICDSMTRWLIYMGVPVHLITTGCVSVDEILKYTNHGDKDLTAMHISNLVIYDKPKELREFKRFCDGVGGKIGCRGCEYYYSENTESGSYEECCCDNLRPITRPPQSWCYVEERSDK